MRTRVSFTATTLAFFAVPLIASAAAPKNLVDLANQFAALLNSGATLLVLVGLVIYFAGIAGALFKKSQGDAKGGGELRKMLLSGIIVLFVMVSIWGILQFLQNTLFGNNSNATGSATSPGTNLQFTNTPPSQ